MFAHQWLSAFQAVCACVGMISALVDTHNLPQTVVCVSGFPSRGGMTLGLAELGQPHGLAF